MNFNLRLSGSAYDEPFDREPSVVNSGANDSAESGLTFRIENTQELVSKGLRLHLVINPTTDLPAVQIV